MCFHDVRFLSLFNHIIDHSLDNGNVVTISMIIDLLILESFRTRSFVDIVDALTFSMSEVIYLMPIEQWFIAMSARILINQKLTW